MTQHAKNAIRIDCHRGEPVRGGELATKTTRQLRDADRLQQAFLACSLDSARAAKHTVPNIRICNMDRQTEPARYAAQTLQERTEFIQLLGSQPGSLQQIPLLRKHQVRINWCCTNDADELRKLFAAGAEFVLVDRLDPLLDVAAELGIERNRPRFRVKSTVDAE